MPVVVFYIFGIIAILSTIFVILNYHPIYALLSLIISLLSMACNFFYLGAAFAGAIEIIIYAGAIMILFVFVVMMMNPKVVMCTSVQQRSIFFDPVLCVGVVLLAGILLAILLYISFFASKYCFININTSGVDIKQIGVTLFGSYILIVELASFLLLSALVSVFHLAREHKLSITDSIVTIQSKEYKI